MESKQKRRDKRCAPRLRELLERWEDLDEQARVAREAQMRAIEAKWNADQRLHKIELQQRWCVLDALRFLDMTD